MSQNNNANDESTIRKCNLDLIANDNRPSLAHVLSYAVGVINDVR